MPQTIQWTLLPDGRVDGKFRFSIFVTPRLSGASTLGSFPDWTNWPKLAATLKPRLTIGNQPFTDPAITPRALPGLLTPAEASQWWQTLFPATTPVSNGAPEKFGALPILSYPLGSIAKGMQGLYGAAGVAQLVGGFTLEQSVGLATVMGVGGGRNRSDMGKARIDPTLKAPTSSARAASLGQQFAGDLALLRLFFGDAQKTAATKPGPSRSAWPGLKMGGDEPDFHQRISLLGDYPAILRSLGLILDFELSAPPTLGGETKIWVEMSSGPTATSVSPRTATGSNYRAVPRAVMQEEAEKTAPELSPEGFFNVGGDAWSVLEFDAEGGAFKLDNFLQNSVSASTYPAPDTPKTAPVPSLRAAGLALCRLNRGAVLAKSLDDASHNADSTSATPATLYADDLVQGVRVDVREVESTGIEINASKLTPSIGTFKVTPDLKQAKPLPNLGRLQPNLGSLQSPQRLKRKPLGRVGFGANAPAGASSGSTGSPSGSPSGAGKSTIPIPKPGTGIGTSVKAGSATGVGGLILGNTSPAKLTDLSGFKAGPWQSLCRRNGRYSLGAKELPWIDEGWVAPAFAQKTLDGTAALGISEAIFRWNDWSLVVAQPDPPKVPATPKPNPGPQSPALTLPKAWALESAFEIDGALLPMRFGRTYQFRARAVDLAGNGPDYGATGGDATDASDGFYARFEPVSSPILVPTRDLSAKVQSGTIYDPLKSTAGESNDRLVIRSDVGKAPSLASERHVMPPRAEFSVALAHGVFDDASGKPDRAASPLLARLGATAPPVIASAKADVPYLADPLGQSANLVSELLLDLGMVKATSPWLEIPFFTDVPANAGAWMWRLKSVIEGQKPTAVLEKVGAFSAFTVALSPGQVAKFRVACSFDEDNLVLMGQWRWIKAFVRALKLSAADEKNWIDLLRILAANGLHDSFTPGRVITLVHAVQRPLISPKFSKLEAGRNEGDTGCGFAGLIDCDAKTSAKIDVMAQWSEPVDDAISPNPDTTRINKNAVAFDFPLHFHPLDDPCAPHNDVPLVAATKLLVAHLETLPANGDKRDAVGEFSPSKKQLAFTLVSPALRMTFRTPRHEFGDTKYRRVEYHGVATSRFREYFIGAKTDGTTIVPPVTRGEDKERQFVALDIPASARPLAPKVHSVVPTFRWNRAKDSSKRTGGLRIYLERPWFSSGDGELLAVLLPSPKNSDSGSTIQSYTTQWGRDPIWTGPGAGAGADAATLTAANFPRRVTIKGETSYLTIAEVSNLGVDIAPHAVAFDAERNQWFCDLEVDLPDSAYFPLIRLALARYQPISVPTVELSNVVLAEFAQITPDRSLSLVRSASVRGGTLAISVSGTIPRTNVIEARLERKVGAGDLSWLPVGDATELSVGPTETNATRSGTLTVALAAASGSFRVTIREYEMWQADGDEPMRRLVYAENLELQSATSGGVLGNLGNVGRTLPK